MGDQPQQGTNVCQRGDREFREGRARMLQVGFGVFHDRRNILDADDQIAGTSFVERGWGEDSFDYRRHGLTDIEGGVVLPAAIHAEFPMDAGEC